MWEGCIRLLVDRSLHIWAGTGAFCYKHACLHATAPNQDSRIRLQAGLSDMHACCCGCRLPARKPSHPTAARLPSSHCSCYMSRSVAASHPSLVRRGLCCRWARESVPPDSQHALHGPVHALLGAAHVCSPVVCVMMLVPWQVACTAVVACTLQSSTCVFHPSLGRQHSPKRNP